MNATVKKHESHPIEEFWNEYKRKRQQAADPATQDPNSQEVVNPNSAAPASGQLDNINL